MKEILEHTIEYMKKTIPEFKRSGKIFTCPSCKDVQVTCGFLHDYTYVMSCQKCRFNGEITDLICPDKNEALAIIRDTLKLEIKTDNELNDLLSFYEENKFDLVPVQQNNKVPIEKDWTNKNHKDKEEWEMWLQRNHNIGIKTGKVSNITVIDFDNIIPDELKDIIAKNPTMSQKTNKGAGHYFYQYEEDLPKTRLQKFEIDIENDGGQVVVEPSVIDKIKRTVTRDKIAKMSPELKKFLVENGAKKKKVDLREDNSKLSNIDLADIPEGSRNHFLMKIGGTLRKELNAKQLEYSLSVINQLACKPRLDHKEFSNILTSLSRYDDFDEKDLAKVILRYIEVVEECGWRDIKEALGFPKERIDKVLKYLEKEGYLIKKRRMYLLIKRAEWRDTWMEESKESKIKIPYLHDSAIIRNGDLIIIGGGSGSGKTHLAMNMVKGIVNQGCKPYYISLESGSRFSIIARDIGLKEQDFNWCSHFSPESIEIEPNAITFIDWLLPRDYASTDKTYEHFSKQLVKQGGILIVFCQLRRDGSFFAEDMIKFFPAIVAKFLYEDPESGENSYFETIKLRESKLNGRQRIKISCTYDWKSKLLIRKDGLEY